MTKKAQKAQKTREILAQITSPDSKAGKEAGRGTNRAQEEQASPRKAKQAGQGKSTGKPSKGTGKAPATSPATGRKPDGPIKLPRTYDQVLTPLQQTRSKLPPRLWRPLVINTLKQMPVWRIAAQSAGITRQSLMEYRDRHPDFAQQCETAMQEGFELLRATTLQRATTGWKRPIFSKDKEGNPVQVGEENMYSDRLAEVWLKAQYREEFNPKIQQEITGPGGQALTPAVIAPTIIFQIPDNGRLPKQLQTAPVQLPELAPEPQEEQESDPQK